MTKKLDSKNTIEVKNYNLKNDVIFQTFFSRKGNEKFLIEFLSAILNKKIETIEIQEEVNLEKLAREEKGGRLDLQAKLDDGTIVSIEMQLENRYNMEQRTTFYGSKVVSKETKRGADYRDIKQVIMINILDYNFLKVDDYVSKTAIVLDKHRDYEVLKWMKWYFIELPKFRKSKPDMNDAVNQWLAFIDDYRGEMAKMAEKKNATLKEAKIEMNYLTGDAEIRRIAELREKWEMDRVSDMNYAREKGLAEGIAEGEARGKAERAKEIAKKLLKTGMPIKNVSEVTGLSTKEVQAIAEKLDSEK